MRWGRGRGGHAAGGMVSLRKQGGQWGQAGLGAWGDARGEAAALARPCPADAPASPWES